MNKITLFTLFAAASGFALACNGDNTQTDGGPDSGPADTGSDINQNKDTGTDSGGNPPPPTLLTQIDRMGRPAINTALNHVFDPACTAQTCAAKDSYNADKQVANWGTNYTAQFRGNLAILDALDTMTLPGDGCGNQAAYTLGGKAPYSALAGLTADDELYVDTSKSTCTMYLAVELQATGIKANSDCGGRGLAYDVINITYATAAGPQVAVTDGPTVAVPSKTDGKAGGSTVAFPYLAPPQ